MCDDKHRMVYKTITKITTIKSKNRQNKGKQKHLDHRDLTSSQAWRRHFVHIPSRPEG